MKIEKNLRHYNIIHRLSDQNANTENLYRQVDVIEIELELINRAFVTDCCDFTQYLKYVPRAAFAILIAIYRHIRPKICSI